MMPLIFGSSPEFVGTFDGEAGKSRHDQAWPPVPGFGAVGEVAERKIPGKKMHPVLVSGKDEFAQDHPPRGKTGCTSRLSSIVWSGTSPSCTERFDFAADVRRWKSSCVSVRTVGRFVRDAASRG